MSWHLWILISPTTITNTGAAPVQVAQVDNARGGGLQRRRHRQRQWCPAAARSACSRGQRGNGRPSSPTTATASGSSTASASWCRNGSSPWRSAPNATRSPHRRWRAARPCAGGPAGRRWRQSKKGVLPTCGGRHRGDHRGLHARRTDVPAVGNDCEEESGAEEAGAAIVAHQGLSGRKRWNHCACSTLRAASSTRPSAKWKPCPSTSTTRRARWPRPDAGATRLRSTAYPARQGSRMTQGRLGLPATHPAHRRLCAPQARTDRTGSQPSVGGTAIKVRSRTSAAGQETRRECPLRHAYRPKIRNSLIGRFRPEADVAGFPESCTVFATPN